MTIAPDQARELLDGATPGPWDAYTVPAERATAEYTAVSLDNREMVVPPRDGGMGTALDSHLIAAAPDLAQTIAGMRWEYSNQYLPLGETRWRTQKWEPTPGKARTHRAYYWMTDPKDIEYRLVRRLVGPVEETE